MYKPPPPYPGAGASENVPTTVIVDKEEKHDDTVKGVTLPEDISSSANIENESTVKTEVKKSVAAISAPDLSQKHRKVVKNKDMEKQTSVSTSNIGDRKRKNKVEFPNRTLASKL